MFVIDVDQFMRVNLGYGYGAGSEILLELGRRLAAIVPAQGAQVTLEQVRAWAERTVAHYALPREIAIIEKLPRSQIGKVMRRLVREDVARMLGRETGCS